MIQIILLERWSFWARVHCQSRCKLYQTNSYIVYTFPSYSASEKKLRILEKIRQELPPVPDIELEPISEEVLQMHGLDACSVYSSATAEVPIPFWAAAPKGSMTFAFTHMGDFLLLLLLLLLLLRTPPPLPPASRPISQPGGP